MKRSCALFPFLIFLLVAIGMPVAGAAGRISDKSFLWEVRSKGATVYLFGSIHLAQQNLYPLDQKIEKAFEASDTLVVEAEVDRVDQQTLQRLTLSHALSPSGKGLRSYLSDDLYEEVRVRLARSGAGIEQFEPFKPWFVAMTLATLELRKLGFEERFGLDRHFLDRAREEGKHVLGLESVEFQMELFGQIIDRDQELYLKYTLLNLEGLERLMEKLVAAWKGGDTEGVGSVLRTGLAGHPELESVYRKIVDDRNRLMTAKIVEYLSSSDRKYFVVVGAGHLVGKKGIVELLRSKGFKVRQL